MTVLRKLSILLLFVFVVFGTVGGCGNEGDGDVEDSNGPLGEPFNGTRTIKLVNSCKEIIWVGTQNIAGNPNFQLNAKGCTADANCQNDNNNTGTCNMDTGNCEQTIQVDTNCNSCKLWPRTGCNFQSGFTCPSGVMCCATGGISAPEAPVTVAEFTFQAETGKTDFYDISIIDGVNVPVEMAPVKPFDPVPSGFPENFWCGNPGGPTSTVKDSFNCPWENLLGNECDSNLNLRVVEPIFADNNNPCPAGSTMNELPIGTVCTCTKNEQCGSDLICGLGNPQTVKFKMCGTFGGCTTPKALCGVGQYFSCATNKNQVCKTSGEDCTENNECTSGSCMNNTCTESPADFLGCRNKFPRTVTCNEDSDCPVLTGLKFVPGQACDCPEGTKCVRIDAAGNQSCQMTCEMNQVTNSKMCMSMGCSEDSDCINITSTMSCQNNIDCMNALGEAWVCNTFLGEEGSGLCQKATGTFMLCDTMEDSITQNQCVATLASMFENQGINGQSCVNPFNLEGCTKESPCSSGSCVNNQCTELKFNAATTLCSGCATDTRNQLSNKWPKPTQECTKSSETTGDCDTIGCNNEDWVKHVQPHLAIFKEACPTTYTFPFGDVTATFQCSSTNGSNSADYDIIFCPSESS